MCIAIFNHAKGVDITREEMKNSYGNNPDGAGLLWVENGVLKSFKTFDVNKWIEKYQYIKKNYKDSHVVLHARIATSGVLNFDNTHPFIVHEGKLGFVHNGIIDKLGDSSLSDTWHFNNMLKELQHNFLNNNTIMKFIAEFIGYSKLVFLDRNNNFAIVNDDLGVHRGLNWFSNTTADYYYKYESKGYNKTGYKTYGKKSCDTCKTKDELPFENSTESEKLDYRWEDDDERWNDAGFYSGTDYSKESNEGEGYVSESELAKEQEESKKEIPKVYVEDVLDGEMCPYCNQGILQHGEFNQEEQTLPIWCEHCGYGGNLVL